MDHETLKRWSTTSPLIRSREEAENAFAARPRAAVTPEQVSQLEALGNTSENWSEVMVPGNFDPASVADCRFEGRVELGGAGEGRYAGGGRPGLYRSLLRNCRIDDEVSIIGCGRIERVFIGRGAEIEGVGRLSLTGNSSRFGNDLELFSEPLYSRALRAVAELPFDWAVRATGPGAEGRRSLEFEEALRSAAGAYAQRFESTTAYVAAGASIRATPVVENCWVGAGVRIDAAGTLRDSTFWAEPERPTFIGDGAQVHASLVGPGCHIADQCLVRHTIVVEAARIGDQAIVKQSLIGPNVRLGECEINDSLLGPFATALHHSLVIAAWWPEGRGNIGYGANVGSNHTGRAPDQEIWPGEGVFFGLGCNIKLPSNFRGAPYTLIATATDTLPQKVLFPFSLISKSVHLPPGISRSLNEIRPGWALLHNAYGLERQNANQIARNLAVQTTLRPGAFHAELAPLLQEARARLVDGARDDFPFYTEAEIPGLGKNFMTEEARREAIEAYAFGLSLIAARTLLSMIEEAGGDPVVAVPESRRTAAFEFAGRILGNSEPVALVKAALSVEGEWLDLVAASKSKDDMRGSRTLDDYAERHVSAGDDPLILERRAWIERRRLYLTGTATEILPRTPGGRR